VQGVAPWGTGPKSLAEFWQKNRRPSFAGDEKTRKSDKNRVGTPPLGTPPGKWTDANTKNKKKVSKKIQRKKPNKKVDEKKHVFQKNKKTQKFTRK